MEAASKSALSHPAQRAEICGMSLDQLDLDQVLDWVFAATVCAPATYVVTPNAAHFVQAAEDPTIKTLYDAAGLRVNDSRVVARISRIVCGVPLLVTPGSDLIRALLTSPRIAESRVFVVGLKEGAFRKLKEMFPRLTLVHHNPPMGFINDTLAVETCLQLLRQDSEPKIVIFALGAPQQEMLAAKWGALSDSVGVGICSGASLDFIVGEQVRAPLFVQRAGLEWLFRLLFNPKRLWKRYLSDSPRLLIHMLRFRKKTRAVQKATV